MCAAQACVCQTELTKSRRVIHSTDLIQADEPLLGLWIAGRSNSWALNMATLRATQTTTMYATMNEHCILLQALLNQE